METDACNKLASGVGLLLVLTMMVIDSSNLSRRGSFVSLDLSTFRFCGSESLVSFMAEVFWVTPELRDKLALPCRYSVIGSDHLYMLTVWGSLC